MHKAYFFCDTNNYSKKRIKWVIFYEVSKIETGLSDKEVLDSRRLYGSNILTHKKNFTFARSRKERVSRLSTYGQMKTAARLIDKGNDISLNLVQKAKKSLKNNSNKIRNIYDNKKICGDSGENMVDELNKMYDNLIEENKENSKEDEKW